jgi:hypothetical protein
MSFAMQGHVDWLHEYEGDGQWVSLFGSNDAVTNTVITYVLPTKHNLNTLTKINVTGLPAQMGHFIAHHHTYSIV